MKKVVVLFVLAALLALPLGGAMAQGLGGPYNTGVQIQNLGSTTANVVLSFYDQTGVEPNGTPVNDTIGANASKTYFPLNALPSGFNGSMVVSSDQPVKAIANVVLTDISGGAAYGGFDAGSTTVNLPLVMKNNYGLDTWVNVQNTGSAQATINIVYKPGTCTDTKTVKPNASVTIDQSNTACLGTSFSGAATITSDQPVVAAVMQVQRTGKSLLAYNGFAPSASATNPVMPLVSSNWYKSGTGIQVQNTGSASTDVTITYTPSTDPTFPGNTCSEMKTIPAGQSATFGFPQMPTACYSQKSGVSDPVLGGFVGAGKVTGNTSNQPLVAIVNQVTRATNGIPAASSAAYDGVNPALATNKVSMPNINDRNYGLFTGFSVANVGTQPTNVTCTFSGSSVTASATNLAPGAALTHVQYQKLTPGYVGSASCTATGGDAKIAGIVNQTQLGKPASWDVLLVYDAFNY